VVTVGSNPEALKRESQTIEEIRGLIIKEIPSRAETVRTEKRAQRFDAQIIINSNL
jgi:hypothetical protein